MAGDPLRDAFRAELVTIVGNPPAGAFAGWVIKDTLNTTERPDASVDFLSLRFGGANEQLFSWGSPGSNQWKEGGEVFVDFFPRLGIGHDKAETAARALQAAFRSLAAGGFAMQGGQRIRLISVSPPLGGPVDGAWWCETVAMSYRTFNIG